MSVGIAFLRQRADGTWEGDYTSVGRGTFSEFQDLIFSLPGSPYFLTFREDEYDVELDKGPPPYPAQVTPDLAKDLENWMRYTGSRLAETLRQVPPDQIESYARPLKSLVEQRLAEGYAVIVSY